MKDFSPVSLVYSIRCIWSEPGHTCKVGQGTDFLAKANPGKLGFASIGNGSSVHLTARNVQAMEGSKCFTYPTVAAMEGMRSHGWSRPMMFDGSVTALRWFGKASFVCGNERHSRSDSAPDVPTIAEAGCQDSRDLLVRIGLQPGRQAVVDSCLGNREGY